MLKWDETLWADNFRKRAVDMWSLAYGTNESTDVSQPIEEYESKLRQTIARFKRAAPQASCVLIGPGDVPQRDANREMIHWSARPRMLQIIDVQRRVAYESGCGFWDAMAFMGGPGSMHRWATSHPPMASRDHVHLTKRGYTRMGMSFTDSMMAGYDREG